MLSRFIELADNCDVADSIGWTPLFWAANNGHCERPRCCVLRLCAVCCFRGLSACSQSFCCVVHGSFPTCPASTLAAALLPHPA